MPTIPNLPEVQSGDLITAGLQNAQSEAIGIINAALEAHAGPGGHPLATQQADGLMAAADKTKLDGVAPGATKTPLGTTMATALGTAAAGTMGTAARSDHVHPMPTAAQVGAAPASHGHAISNVTGLQTALDGKASTTHTHTAADVGAAPASHGHAISEVTGLQTALDGKAASSHTHTIGNVTGLQTALDGKAASSHGHAISEVTGLQTALDGKAASSHTHTAAQVGAAPASHTHTTSQVTGLDTALGAKAPLASPTFTGTVGVPTLNLTNALAQSKTHANADTDTSTSSIHHTLGPGPTQAAPGNHTHDGYAPQSGNTLNQIRNGLPSYLTSEERSPYDGLAPYWEFWGAGWTVGIAGVGGMNAFQYIIQSLANTTVEYDLDTALTDFSLPSGTAAGRTFTLQWEEFMDALTQGQMMTVIEWYNASGTLISSSTIHSTTPANKAPGWAFRWGSAVAPANTTKFKVVLRAKGAAAGVSPGYVGYRRLKLEENTGASTFSTERDAQEGNAGVLQFWREDANGREVLSRKAGQLLTEPGYELAMRSQMFSGVGFGIKNNGDAFFGFGLTSVGKALLASNMTIQQSGTGLDIHSPNHYAFHMQSTFDVYTGAIGSGRHEFRVNTNGHIWARGYGWLHEWVRNTTVSVADHSYRFYVWNNGAGLWHRTSDWGLGWGRMHRFDTDYVDYVDHYVGAGSNYFQMAAGHPVGGDGHGSWGITFIEWSGARFRIDRNGNVRYLIMAVGTQ